MSRFQDYLYLDQSTVARMLSVVDGGEFDSVSERLTQSLDSADEVDHGSRSTTASSSEQERLLRQTPEARFARLWKAIEGDEDEQVAVSLHAKADIEEELKEGQFCKLQGTLGVPQLIAVVAASSELLQLGQLMRRFGVSPGESEMEQLENISTMKEMIKDRFPVTLTLDGNAAKIALPLDTQSSRVRVDAYLGRATVYGRVVEKIDADGTFPFVNIPGAAHMAGASRQQRRAAARRGESSENEAFELRGPVTVVKALAVAQ